jgi:FOG: EAL domain
MKNHVCHLCTSKPTLNFDFSMAFQPIVDLTDKSILSYEALVRGSNNEPAASVFARINNINIYRFDQLCRMKAIELAARHKLKTRLSINFMPGAVYSPARCLRSTLETASRFDFPIERICFEVVESRKVQNLDYLQDIINTYQNLGFSTIFDDFGTGFASYEWLAVLNPDAIKIDMSVVRDVDKQKKKQIIL